MKNYLIILFCSFISFLNAQKKFNKEGVSFNIPKDWSITEEEDWDGEGYYLSVEKDGLDSSGMVTMTWINGEIDLDEWLEETKTDFKTNLGKNSKLKFDKEVSTTYNNIESKSVSYTFSLIGFKHRGNIILFYKNGKSFLMIKQEANEDIKKNKKGFVIIEESFLLE